MATGDNRLPEGTDTIIGGASYQDNNNRGAGSTGSGGGRMGIGATDDEPLASEQLIQAAASRVDANRAIGSGMNTGGTNIGAGSTGSTKTGGEQSGGTDGQRSTSTRETLQDARTRIVDKTTELRGQATEKARNYAVQGKDRAADKLDEFQRMIDDAANTIDSKVGEQYGA